jgi:hypothetical protein
MEKKPNSKKLWIWIIAGILLISGIGLVTYLLWPKKSVESKSIEQTTENESIKAFKNQVAKIKKVQQDLNQAVLQHENILKERQKDASRNKQTDQQIKDLKRLEKYITDLKTKKRKVDQILPKLEEQINKFSQESEPNQEEIKGISEELGISYEPVEEISTNNSLTKNKSASNPASENTSPNKINNSSDQNNPNLQQFQTLRNQAQELVEELEKIIKRDEEAINNWDSQEQQVKEAANNLVGGNMQKYMNNLQHHLSAVKSNKQTLAGYASEQDYQTFLSSSSETQKANLGLIEDAIKHTLKSFKEHLDTLLGFSQEMFKMVEDMFKGLEESGLVDEEAKKGKQEMEEGKKVISNCQAKLGKMEKLDIAEQIKIIKEVWQKLEELDKQN